jgi:hypothetical protein
MAKWIFFVVLFVRPLFLHGAGMDKNAILSVLNSTNVVKLKTWCQNLEKADPTAENKAYLGALKMKMAQFEATPKLKLATFNKGKSLLEAAINTHHSNTEFRFLRLMIQENAPVFLNYTAQLKTDAQQIHAGFKQLSVAVQKHVRAYAQTSKYLNVNLLKLN